jgi:antitoxin component YwqK of YwqJK toxin-antitoxin module
LIFKGSVFAFQCDTSKTLLGKVKVTCTKSNCPAESVITIFEDGVFQKKYTYYSCKDSGQFLTFSKNGDTLTKSYFIGNKTVGLAIYKFSNEKIKSFLNFNSQGKKHGLCETWREDGTRKDSTVYRNDTIIEEREYFTSGKVRQWFKKCLNAHFVEAYFYHPDGTSAGKIVKGNGIVTGYTETADRKFIDRYENGSLVESKEIKN